MGTDPMVKKSFSHYARARPLAVPPGALRAAPLRKQSFLRRIVGYAAEYLTRGRFPAIPMGFPLLMSICCILYHFPLLHVLHVLHGYSYTPTRSTCSTRLKPFRVFRGSILCVLCQNMRCEPSWRVFGDRCKAALFRVFSDESHLQHAVVKEECSRAKWQGCPHILKAA